MRDSGSRRVSVSHFFSFFLHPARAACNATHLLLAPVKPASAALPAYPWLPIAETTVSQPHGKTFFFFFFPSLVIFNTHHFPDLIFHVALGEGNSCAKTNSARWEPVADDQER